MAPKTVPLRSDPFPEFKTQTIVRITIGPGGAITEKPRKFYASKKERDIVTWEITNRSRQLVTVRVMEFLCKNQCSDSKGAPPQVYPFIWLHTDTVDVDAPDRSIGDIDGRVDPNYQFRNPSDYDCLSYTISVVSTDPTNPFEIYYDPDGDIKP